MKIFFLLSSILTGTSVLALGPPRKLSASDVKYNSFQLFFRRPAGAVSYGVEVVALHLSSDVHIFNTSSTEVKVDNLNPNVIYDVTVQSVSSSGIRSMRSRPLRVRTTPNGAWVSVSKPLIPRSITVFLEPVAGATEWTILLRKIDNAYETLVNVTRPYIIFHNLLPNTEYSVRAKVSRIGTIAISQWASPFGNELTFTTAQLSVFGRVILLAEDYVSDLDSISSVRYLTTVTKWESALVNEYMLVNSNVTEIKILELRNSSKGLVCHHEIFISVVSLPEMTSFRLQNKNLFSDLYVTNDVNPDDNYVIFWHGIKMIFFHPSYTCDDIVNDTRHFHLTRGDSTSDVLVVDMGSREGKFPDFQAPLSFNDAGLVADKGTTELVKNSIYSIDQNYLLKFCLKRDRGVLLYTRYYGAFSNYTLPGFTSTFIHSTDPEAINISMIAYESSESSSGIVLRIPSIFRAAFYNFSIDGVTSASVTDTDSSTHVEVLLSGIESSKEYLVKITVTINHPDWNQSTSAPVYFPFYSGPPDPVPTFRIVEVMPRSFTVLYSAVEYATKYVIQVTNAQKLRNHTTTASNRYTVTDGIKADEVRIVQIAAKNSFGTSDFSSPRSSKFWSFHGINETFMVLTWENETGDTSYEVEIPQKSLTEITSVSKYEISGLSAGTVCEVSIFLKSSDDGRMHLFTDIQITVAEAPSNLSLVSKTIKSLEVNWDVVKGADSYILSVNGKNLSINGNRCNIEGLEPGTIYTLDVHSSNTAGISLPITRSYQTIPVSPFLRIRNITKSSFIVLWNSSHGAVSYHLTLEDKDGETVSEIETTTQTSAYIDGVNLTISSYYVLNLIAVTESGDLSEKQNRILTLAIPDPPDDFRLQRRAETTLTLTWNISLEVEKYQVVLNGSRRKTTTTNVIVFHNLQRGVVYLASITAVSNLQISSGTISKYFQTLPTSPRFNITNTTRTSFVITWNNVTGAEGYEVRVLMSNSSVPIEEYITNMTSHLVTNLTHGTWYDVTVTSVIGTERSQNPDITKSITISPPPSDVKVKSIRPDSVTIQWKASVGATTYPITVMSDLTNHTSFEMQSHQPTANIENLSPGTSYNVTIAASNPAGVSDAIKLQVLTADEFPSMALPQNDLQWWAFVAIAAGAVIVLAVVGLIIYLMCH